jgi:hypothetical protein
VIWNKWTNQGYRPIPTLFTVETNRLVLNRATPEAAGTYQVIVRNPSGEDRQELTINVEPRRSRNRQQQAGAPQIRFDRDQYELAYGEVVDIIPTISVSMRCHTPPHCPISILGCQCFVDSMVQGWISRFTGRCHCS